MSSEAGKLQEPPRPKARIVSINVNPRGGVPKHRVERARLTVEKVEGDKQRDLRHHGGPERAVSLYSMERIQELRQEGHPISPGSAGENLTISGLNWPELHLGDRLRIGDIVEIQFTSYVTPCLNIQESFVDGAFNRIAQRQHPGWSRLYARVLNEGEVCEGDEVVWFARDL